MRPLRSHRISCYGHRSLRAAKCLELCQLLKCLWTVSLITTYELEIVVWGLEPVGAEGRTMGLKALTWGLGRKEREGGRRRTLGVERRLNTAVSLYDVYKKQYNAILYPDKYELSLKNVAQIFRFLEYLKTRSTIVITKVKVTKRANSKQDLSLSR